MTAKDTSQMIPTSPVEGAVFYGRFAGNARSPRLATFEEAKAFNKLENYYSEDMVDRSVDLIGFAAGTADKLWQWDSVAAEWIEATWPIYNHGQFADTPHKSGPREISFDEFNMLRSTGIEDQG